MSNSIRIGLASAAVVAAVAVGAYFFGAVGGPSIGDAPTPSPDPEQTATALPAFGDLASDSTYLIEEPFPLRVSLTLTDDWSVWAGTTGQGAAVYQVSPDPPSGRGIVIVTVANLVADPCQPASGSLQPELGPTVEDLASGLAGQPSTEASEITDVTLSGYSGKHLEYSFTGPTGGCGSLTRFQTVSGPRMAIAGEYDEVWILDVEGTRLMIDAFWFEPGVTDEELEELRKVVESIVIEVP